MLPQYRKACSVKRKSKLLDAFTAATGYNRKYAMGLLNHAQEVQPTLQRPRPRQYGPDVQHALFLVWHAATRICTKRLIPFLPTLLEALERHEHLHLTEECRKQLLSMSAATADRLLASQRKLDRPSLSTTRAGTLLKQQIPIRTFQEWNEARPGFLEADLVAHCGTDIEGGYLYTLTLTDVATGWTECLPLLHRSQFSVERCRAGDVLAERSVPDPAVGLYALYREQERRKRVLGWRRTHKDPFEGEWEQILSWLVANPERSSGDIFRELQRRSPGRYHPLQIRTLQRGMRKIRASLLETVEEQWQAEVIHGRSPQPVSSAANPARSF
jgi:hypothetical protein